MKQRSLFSLLLAIASAAGAQAQITLSPYLKAVTAMSDGNVEVGPQFSKGGVAADTSEWRLRTVLRMKLTDKETDLLQVDRNTTDWSVVGELTRTADRTTLASRSLRRSVLSLQFEYGSSRFTYYPSASTDDGREVDRASFSLEAKWMMYRMRKIAGARQWAPQLRLRYTNGWTAATTQGVVRRIDSTATYTMVEEMIIGAPSESNTLAPAFACNYYPGDGNFSFVPAIYYNATWGGGQTLSDGTADMRFELWSFFYPSESDMANCRIGVSPFLTVPMDPSTGSENNFGGLFTIQFKTSFFRFF